MKGIPEKLKTDRLLLRFVRADDVFSVYSYACDESIDMMMFYPHRSIEETEKYVMWALSEYQAETAGDIEYLVEYDGKVAGGVAIDFYDDGSAELGWLIASPYRGRGFATEAALALIDLAKQCGVKKVFARCDSRNAASEKVMRKLGMELTDDTGVREYPRTGESSGEKTYTLML